MSNNKSKSRMAGTYDIEDASWGWQWVCSPIAGYTAIELVSEICTGCPIAGAGLSGLLLASLGCGDAHGNNTGRPFRNCVKRTNPVCNSCVTRFSTCS